MANNKRNPLLPNKDALPASLLLQLSTYTSGIASAPAFTFFPFFFPPTGSEPGEGPSPLVSPTGATSGHLSLILIASPVPSIV